MRSSRVTSLILVLVVCAVLIPAVRADSANNAFRIGAGYLDPDGEVDVSGVHFDADSTACYFVSYERRLIPWLGIDFEVLYADPDINATPIGGGATQTNSEQIFLGNAGINFHVLARSRVDLYLGAYFSYANFDKIFDDATGYGALAGIDIGLTKSGLLLNATVRYTLLQADLTQYPGASADFDPLVYQLGIGWRF
jgi:hypothetical protein